MTTAPLLLSDLTTAGFRLRLDGEALLVTPGSRLTADQRADIARCKAELVKLVRARGNGPLERPWRAKVIPLPEVDEDQAVMAALDTGLLLDASTWRAWWAAVSEWNVLMKGNQK